VLSRIPSAGLFTSLILSSLNHHQQPGMSINIFIPAS